jgi:hypothetical protein
MAEFDGMLLKEQQLLEEKQRRDPLPERGGGTGGTATGGEGDGEGAGKRGDDRTAAEKQADAEAAAAEQGKGAPAAGTQPADTGTGGSASGRADGGTPVTAPVEGGGAGGSDGDNVPPDVGDGKDDDVVARQLREAAMKEKDPAIREKLWQEYRDYKKGTGKD